MESPSLERNGVSSFHLLGVGLCAFPLNMTSLIWAIAAKDNRKYAKSKSPKPSSVPESAGTSSAPFGNLFGPGLPEHKVAPVVFGAGEFEHKRFCMDVSTNRAKKSMILGPLAQAYLKTSLFLGDIVPRYNPITGGKPIIVSMPRARDQDR